MNALLTGIAPSPVRELSIMPKPTSHALVVSTDERYVKRLQRGLAAAARALDNPFGLRFSTVASHHDALARLAADGDLQAVLIDESGDRQSHGEAARQLVRAVHAWRPEVDVYVLVGGPRDQAGQDAWLEEPIDGYFQREERDDRGWFRTIQAQLAARSRTPFYDALKSYVAMANDAWHTPGHSGGDSLRGSPWIGEFQDFMGEHVFRADLSVSVDMLDSLLDPTGVILEAQKLAADAFGARRTFFATNGTSTANKVILQTLLTPGDKLLLDRNCHKSVHHGVVLSGARPIYLDSSINRKYGLFGPVPQSTLLGAIATHPEAKALVLTSCTYDGLRYDLPPIIAAAHRQGIKVIIDEAWYGHARFHPAFRPTALECGADYATQSTHKVLTAFSQASMIHVNDPDFDPHVFRENFNMHTSTSPQYSMIASLDVGRKQAMMEGYKLLTRALELAAELKAGINATGVFRVLELDDLLPPEVKLDGVRLDPTKLTVDISPSGLTVQDFQQMLFERHHVQVEKSTFNTVSLLLTIGTTRGKVARLLDALRRIAREKRPPRQLDRLADLPGVTELRYLPRDAYYARGEILAMIDNDRRNDALIGKIAADAVVPYPPGIPALVPGQVITRDVLDFLLSLIKSHRRTHLHGVVMAGDTPCLRVLRLTEQQQLTPLAESAMPK